MIFLTNLCSLTRFKETTQKHCMPSPLPKPVRPSPEVKVSPIVDGGMARILQSDSLILSWCCSSFGFFASMEMEMLPMEMFSSFILSKSGARYSLLLVIPFLHISSAEIPRERPPNAELIALKKTWRIISPS